MSIQIGAQMYTLRSFTQTPEGLKDSLSKVKAMGYDHVQLSGHDQQIPAQFIRDAMDELGLTGITTHISFDLMQDDFAAVVKNHRILGAAYPGVGAMPARYVQEGEKGFRQFAKDASQVAKKFKDEGMTFIYHNHDFEFVNFGGPTGYQILIDETDDAVQFELDTYWVQSGGGDPAWWIRYLTGRMDVIHFKDMEIVADPGSDRPIRQAFSEIGNGNLNWQGIFEACEQTGVQYAFVEQDQTRKDSPFTSLSLSRAFLKRSGY